METKNVLTDQSRTQINGFRQLGEILQEFVNMSDSPLAKGYRAYLATKENAKDGGKEDE